MERDRNDADYPVLIAIASATTGERVYGGKDLRALPVVDGLRDYGDEDATALLSDGSIEVVLPLGPGDAGCVPVRRIVKLAPSANAAEEDRPLLAAAAVTVSALDAARQPDPLEAFAAWNRTRELCRVQRGAADPLCVSAAAGLVGAALAARRPPAEIDELAESAASSLERSFGEAHAQTLRGFGLLASAHRRQNRLGDAVRVLDRALVLRTARVGAVHDDTLQTRLDLSEAERLRGNGAAAIAHARFAYESYAQSAGALADRTLYAASALGFALSVDYQAVKAVTMLEPLVARVRDRFVQGDRAAAEIAGALAFSYERAGQRASALELAEIDLAAELGRNGERSVRSRELLGFKGFLLMELGRTEEALPLFERVLALNLEIDGERSRGAVLALQNLATTYSDLGRFREALQMQQRAHQLAIAVHGENYLQTIRLQWAIGESAMALRDYEAAEVALLRALSLYREHFGAGHPQTQAALHTQARLLQATGRQREALAIFEQSWQTQSSSRGVSHYLTLSALSDLAAQLADLGNDDAAAVRQREALTGLERVLGRRHPVTLRAMRRMANALARTGQPQEALRLFSDYIEVAETYRSAQGLSSSNRQSLFASLAGAYRDAAVVAVNAGDPSYAFNVTERAKARTLLETMAERRALGSAGLPVAEIDRLREIESRVARAQGNVVQLTAQPERQALAEAEVNAIVREGAALRERLAGEHPKFRALAEIPLVDAQQAAAQLGADDIVLQLVISEREALGILLSARGAPIARTLGSAKSLGALAAAYRRVIATPPGGRAPIHWLLADGDIAQGLTSPPGALRRLSAANVARMLSDRILEPFASKLSVKRRWIVVPDGALAGVPIEPLPWRGGRVIDRHDVSYAQSMSVFALVRGRLADYRTLGRRHDLLAVGAPEYAPDAALPAAPDLRDLARQLSAGGPATRSAFALVGQAWTSLPDSKREIAEAARLFASSTSLTGRDADEAELERLNRRGALSEYRLLLFSAHGFASIESPALSAIVLSQPPSGAADGFVTAAEWPAYDLRSDLIVLSACETGVGRPVVGEGIIGLPYALFVAGNANAVMTLWNVADRSAARLSVALLRGVREGKSPARALADAKRAVARSRDHASPFHWGAFVLYGA